MHLDEQTIDLLVLNSILLDEETRRSAELHLRACDGCRAVAEKLRSFYRGLEEARELTPNLTEHQERTIRRLMRLAPIVRLHPYAPRPNLAPGQIRNGISILAAKSIPEKGAMRFETVATLASPPDGILARIVLDAESKKFKVYLLVEDPSQREAAILTIPRLSLKLLLDEKGQMEFTLPRSISPGEWEHLEAIVRLPIGFDVVTTAGLRASGAQSIIINGLRGSFETTFTYDEEELSIESRGNTAQLPEYAVIYQTSKIPPLMVELDNGNGKVRMPELPSAFTIRLYA